MFAIGRDFWRDDRGTEMVEWAVVVLILLSFSVVTILAVKSELLQVMQKYFTDIQARPATDF